MTSRQVSGPGRVPSLEMSPEEVVHIIDDLEGRGIDVWLDGGWGVDAALGAQTRSHDDLDLIVHLHAAEELEETLARRGYRRVRGAPPTSFELTDRQGRQVDVHPIALDGSGDGVYRMESGEDWVYPASGFAGTGLVSGRRVRCLTPEVQMLCPRATSRTTPPTKTSWRSAGASAFPSPRSTRGLPSRTRPGFFSHWRLREPTRLT